MAEIRVATRCLVCGKVWPYREKARRHLKKAHPTAYGCGTNMITDIWLDLGWYDKYHLEKEEDPEFGWDLPLPEWAIDRLNGELVVGAQLPTRDGRRLGNAHIIGTSISVYNKQPLYHILTDAGSEFKMSEREVKAEFYPTVWQSNVDDIIAKFKRRDIRSVGYRCWFNKEPDNVMTEFGAPLPDSPNPAATYEELFIDILQEPK